MFCVGDIIKQKSDVDSCEYRITKITILEGTQFVNLEILDRDKWRPCAGTHPSVWFNLVTPARKKYTRNLPEWW